LIGSHFSGALCALYDLHLIFPRENIQFSHIVLPLAIN